MTSQGSQELRELFFKRVGESREAADQLNAWPGKEATRLCCDIVKSKMSNKAPGFVLPAELGLARHRPAPPHSQHPLTKSFRGLSRFRVVLSCRAGFMLECVLQGCLACSLP